MGADPAGRHRAAQRLLAGAQRRLGAGRRSAGTTRRRTTASRGRGVRRRRRRFRPAAQGTARCVDRLGRLPGAAEEALRAAGIDPMARGETLTVAEFARIAEATQPSACPAGLDGRTDAVVRTVRRQGAPHEGSQHGPSGEARWSASRRHDGHRAAAVVTGRRRVRPSATRGVVDTACITTPTARFAPAPDGMVRGFLETGCAGRQHRLHAAMTRRPAAAACDVATPYKGSVLATAQDGTGTYLLYRAVDGVRMAKVLRDGTMPAAAALQGGRRRARGQHRGRRAGRWIRDLDRAQGLQRLRPARRSLRAVRGSPPGRLLPAAPASTTVLRPSRGRAVEIGYLLAFARHTGSGYHLMVAHRGDALGRRQRARQRSTENPQPAITRAGRQHLHRLDPRQPVRLATTAGGTGGRPRCTRSTVPQATGRGRRSEPRRSAYSCGGCYVALPGRQPRTVGRLASTAVGQAALGPARSCASTRRRHRSLAGIAPHCGASARPCGPRLAGCPRGIGRLTVVA